MMHEYEQPDHDADAPQKKIVKTTFLVQYPWVFLQYDMYFCKDCLTNTKLPASLTNDVFFVNCGVAKNKQPVRKAGRHATSTMHMQSMNMKNIMSGVTQSVV